MPEIGDVAPEFTLPSTIGDNVSLGQYKGQKHVLLASIVLAFTGG